jgi:hypothetical protein
MKKGMRIAGVGVALLSIMVGITGLASADALMALRRLYFATPGPFYAAVAVRSTMGFGLILAASHSRWPRTLRALGAVVCLQGLSAALLGLDDARALMEWEGMQRRAFLRGGAAVSLASGGFILFALHGGRAQERMNTATEAGGSINDVQSGKPPLTPSAH